MKITEVKIKLVNRPNDKLLAFACVTFDQCFVVRDIRVIQGNSGLFVAMPSRKMTDRCSNCGAKNHLQANYCNNCGKRQGNNRSRTDARGRSKLHADIAHPINSQCRGDLENAILESFKKEMERSKLPGYKPPADDDFDAGPEGDDSGVSRRGKPAHGKPRPATAKPAAGPKSKPEPKPETKAEPKTEPKPEAPPRQVQPAATEAADAAPPAAPPPPKREEPPTEKPKEKSAGAGEGGGEGKDGGGFGIFA